MYELLSADLTISADDGNHSASGFLIGQTVHFRAMEIIGTVAAMKIIILKQNSNVSEAGQYGLYFNRTFTEVRLKLLIYLPST